MEAVLTPEALAFVAELERLFGARRRELLSFRRQRAERMRRGETFGLLPQTLRVREGDWKVAETPEALLDRRVEITGPAEPKMIINALGCGAKVFMADLEDALSPSWSNVVVGQQALAAAARRELRFTSPQGKHYALPTDPEVPLATLVVRPRGWHLEEGHLEVDGRAPSASLVDFGLYFFHNARYLAQRELGPYFYLAKLESHLEARLWNQVFVYAQERLGVPRGTVRATVLIETLPAAFEMEEILYELREHSAGLNAGRWDYIASVVRSFRDQPIPFPDRSEITMGVSFMRAYTERMVKTCHRRGAHAIGGMAAFIPSRRDPEVNEKALAAVAADKEREARAGFDGTWVAHPDLVPVAEKVFAPMLGEGPHQKHARVGEDLGDAQALVKLEMPGEVTRAGVKTNVSVALRYLAAWLSGRGAVAIDNLMEDAATAEISRCQLWHWIRHEAVTESGELMDEGLYRQEREQALEDLGDAPKAVEAAALLDTLVLAPELVEYLTPLAYRSLLREEVR
ncbi:MAG: malate synthase A [Acidobacteriota bacterium]